jgi:hypothetical protein
MAADTSPVPTARHRPRVTTVFVAAFVAGAAAAVGVNRVLDVQLAQAKPQVECEPIFVALRSLPQGVPVTVWDVALRDWPKAMLPSTALRVTDSFEGCLLKYPLREGQPLLAAQLLQPEVTAPPAEPEVPPATGEEELIEEAFVPPVPAAAPVAVTTTPISRPEERLEPAAEPMPNPGSVATPVEPPVSEPVAVADIQPTEPVNAPELPEPKPAEPAPEPVAIVSPNAAEPSPAAEPTPVSVVGEPTLAEPATASSNWAAVTNPQAIGPQPDASREPAADARSALDLPTQPAVDLSNLPSVVARNEDGAAPSTEHPAAAGDVRYLVVPERIARQADTSFTTPVAPEAKPEIDPALAEVGEASTAAPQRPTEAADQGQARQPQPPQAQQRQARSRSAQAGGQQPGTNRAGSQPSRARAKPQATQPAQPGTRQQAEPDSRKPDPRAWGGMFPNVSAGLEAIGSWRGRVREAVVPQRPEPGTPTPQRR